MSFFLCIETSLQLASVALLRDGICIAEEVSIQQKEHAAFLQPAFKQMFQSSGYSLTDLDAVSVSIGPGSYTGLRVGLASAKGICFAIQKPLITINTLTLMAHVATRQLENTNMPCAYLAPMIDARRNEVFTAVYDTDLNFMMQPQALVLNENSYKNFHHDRICFFGDGSIKWQPQCSQSNALFTDIQITASLMHDLTEQAFTQNRFASLASAVPFYGKEFYTTSNRN
jgi:tRNA threonylcarbamoyladenosine biosynthesis protein TsaB